MLQTPLCGKRLLAAETHMAAGLATALAWHFRPCHLRICLLPADARNTPKRPSQKNSRQKKFRRLKLNNLRMTTRKAAYFLRRIQPTKPRNPPRPHKAIVVGSGTLMVRSLIEPMVLLARMST